MRVMRGKTFEGKRGVWEKIEVELDSSDLLPEETSAPKAVQLQLLEIRADKNLVLFLHRVGQLTDSEARAHFSDLDRYRDSLLQESSNVTSQTEEQK